MNFSVFFTNRCNMNCSYCYEKNKKECSMSYEIIDKTIDFIVSKKHENPTEKLSIVTHGGEPLLEFEKIKYFVSALKNRIENVSYIITTNATLLNDENIDFLIKNYAQISISIDGNEKAHNSNRIFHNRRGSFDIVIQNSKKILDRAPFDICARMTVNRKNVEYLFDGVKWLLDFGFVSISPVPDQYDNNWTDSDMNELYNQGVQIIDYLKGYKGDCKVDLIDDALVRCMNSACDGGRTSFTIDTDGSIYPCLAAAGVSEFVIGSVDNGINHESVERILEWAQAKNQACIGCSRYEYCDCTRCKIINKIYTGDLNTPIVAICNIENVKIRLSQYYQKVFPNGQNALNK